MMMIMMKEDLIEMLKIFKGYDDIFSDTSQSDLRPPSVKIAKRGVRLLRLVISRDCFGSRVPVVSELNRLSKDIIHAISLSGYK